MVGWGRKRSFVHFFTMYCSLAESDILYFHWRTILAAGRVLYISFVILEKWLIHLEYNMKSLSKMDPCLNLYTWLKQREWRNEEILRNNCFHFRNNKQPKRLLVGEPFTTFWKPLTNANHYEDERNLEHLYSCMVNCSFVPKLEIHLSKTLRSNISKIQST